MSGITGTSTTLSGLTQGTTYYIWVSAVSSGVPGTYSMRMSENTYSGNVTIIGHILQNDWDLYYIMYFLASILRTPKKSYNITPTPHTVYTP